MHSRNYLIPYDSDEELIVPDELEDFGALTGNNTKKNQVRRLFKKLAQMKVHLAKRKLHLTQRELHLT